MSERAPEDSVPRQALRAAIVGALAGAASGAIAFGVGSRLAMRLALAMRPEMVGAVTDNRNIAGDITLGGTLFLIFFGTLVGTVGGLAYTLLRDWVPGRGWRKGAWYGVAILGVLGSLLIDAENVDFRKFGSPLVNVIAFALLYLLAGLLVEPLHAAIDARLPPARGRAFASYCVALVPIALVTLLLSIALLGLSRPIGLAVAVALAVVVALRLRPATSHARWIGYAALAIPSVIGTALFLANVRAIVG